MAAELEREQLEHRERNLEGEAEWEERKRTRERVSTLMGQYLLKGYRMLNSSCPECEVFISACAKPLRG